MKLNKSDCNILIEAFDFEQVAIWKLSLHFQLLK